MKVHEIQLRDGRSLAYSDGGPQDGPVVIHCHGSNSSRLERPVDEALLVEKNVRLIVPDRPGHGRSSPQPGRRLLDWADDVVQLADRLGIDQFAVTGYSAGGPHAAAVAHRLPERVSRLGLVSSLAPFDRPDAFAGVSLGGRSAIWVAQKMLWLLERTAGLQAKAVSGNIDRTILQLARTLPPRDKELLDDPAMYAQLAATIKEAYRQGGDGPVQDSAVYARPWGFSVAEIRVPTLVWQGLADGTAVPPQGRYLAATIPQAELIELPEEGHLALYRHWGEVLTAVTTGYFSLGGGHPPN